jgi:rubredoxin
MKCEKCKFIYCASCIAELIDKIESLQNGWICPMCITEKKEESENELTENPDRAERQKECSNCGFVVAEKNLVRIFKN